MPPRASASPSLEREAVADVELLLSGTRHDVVTPSSWIAVMNTPPTPSVTPLRYVPLLALPDESIAVVPVVSSKCSSRDLGAVRHAGEGGPTTVIVPVSDAVAPPSAQRSA